MFPDTHTHYKATRQSLATRADSEDGMGTDLLGSGSGQLGPGLGGGQSGHVTAWGSTFLRDPQGCTDPRG